MSDTCPACDAEPGEATFSTAPNQADCPDDDCPVNTWDPSKTTREPFRVIQERDEHPIPADAEELNRIWREVSEFDEEDAPHPNEAREEYVKTIARWGDWHVFRVRYPFSHGHTVYLWNGMDGTCLAIDGDEGRWHALVNFFAEIVDEEGDCRDAEYSSGVMPSGSIDQNCGNCGSGWLI